MCGIIGSINYEEKLNPENSEWVKSKINMLIHRGPDDKKIWASEKKNIIFGHTKLSIIDLSNKNVQPMNDDDNKITLTYNGEIYNYLKLKKELSKDYSFITNSDTEVIIKSYLKWGEKFLNKIEGMFAFALFDEREKIIYLARDRMGEKPLFYLSNEKFLLFSSELSSFYSLSNIDKKNLNETLLNGFPLIKNNTLLKNVSQVEPGEFIKVNLKERKFFKKKYWNLDLKINLKSSINEKEFEEILNSNIENCFVSDVKTCVTLSGGLDSSLITSIASKQKKIDTFTVVFKNQKFDERDHALKISKYFHTNHNEVEIEDYSLDQILDIIERLDIPIIDSSIIPSFVLFNNLQANNYKVAIGGDGGDEIFGGYNHYRIFNKIDLVKKKFFNLNIPFLNFLTKKLENLNFKGAQYLSFILNNNFVYKIPFFFKKNLRNKLLNSQFFEDVDHLKFEINNFDLIKQSQFIDLNYTLPLSLLNKLDRCSMLNSVESRSPFLSKDIVEYSLTKLKSSDLVSKKDQKIFLKKIGNKYLPNDFIYNRKQGFSFPLIDIIKKENESKKIEEILTSKNTIFKKDRIKMLLADVKNLKIRPELVFCLLNLQMWINKKSDGEINAEDFLNKTN